MVFLDTCIWIELCSVKTPKIKNEIRQAAAASALLAAIIGNKEVIVTCREQLIEVVSAVQKVKMREYNKGSKKGVGSLKEFRMTPEYFQTKELCVQVCDDIKHFAEIHNINAVDIDNILNRIDVADINDCIYYDYCIQNGIRLYTFDGDYKAIDEKEVVTVI